MFPGYAIGFILDRPIMFNPYSTECHNPEHILTCKIEWRMSVIIRILSQWPKRIKTAIELITFGIRKEKKKTSWSKKPRLHRSHESLSSHWIHMNSITWIKFCKFGIVIRYYNITIQSVWIILVFWLHSYIVLTPLLLFIVRVFATKRNEERVVFCK